MLISDWPPGAENIKDTGKDTFVFVCFENDKLLKHQPNREYFQEDALLLCLF